MVKQQPANTMPGDEVQLEPVMQPLQSGCTWGCSLCMGRPTCLSDMLQKLSKCMRMFHFPSVADQPLRANGDNKGGKGEGTHGGGRRT